jgi:DNA repair protein RecN (Recombination protein N)
VTKGVPEDAADDNAGITQSGLSTVTGDERVSELARMLSGQVESASAREHAQELLNLAAVRS